MLFGILWMLLILGIPILAIFALLKYLLDKSASNAGKNEIVPRQTPLDILKEAYARGDIDREEFLQKRDDLQEEA